MLNIRNQLALKTKVVEQQLDLDRVRLTNIHNTNLQRLNYSLEVANAAGIKKPVYSNGQAVKTIRITPLPRALTVSRRNCRSRKILRMCLS